MVPDRRTVQKDKPYQRINKEEASVKQRREEENENETTAEPAEMAQSKVVPAET